MKRQNYANHRRFVPMYHGVLSMLLLLTFIGSIVNFIGSIGDHQRIYSASLIAVLSLCVILLFWYARVFVLRAQDRAIRAEENLRHFVLTGKLLDARLTLRQVIGLRFAADDEFVPLAKRTVEEQLSEDQVKREVKNWRGDYHRA